MKPDEVAEVAVSSLMSGAGVGVVIVLALLAFAHLVLT